MKVIYSIFVVILVLYSCNKSEVFTAKDNTQDNNTATIYRADLDKHATLTVSGELVDTKDEIEVSLGIYDDHSFRGTLNLYGEDIFNTVIHDATNDVAISIIDRVDNETYRLRTSDRKEYLLTEVSVDAGQITGTLNTENKLGQVESTFTIIANSIVDKMNLEYANSNVRVAPWLLAALGGLITTVSCAYERSAARQACHNTYNTNVSSCGCNCTMSFSAGLCGGDCEVHCN